MRSEADGCGKRRGAHEGRNGPKGCSQAMGKVTLSSLVKTESETGVVARQVDAADEKHGGVLSFNRRFI